MEDTQRLQDERSLRAVSDQMISILDRLRAIEVAKRSETIGSDPFVDLAREAEDLSRLVTRWAGLQLQLALESPAAVERGEIEPTAIETVDPRPLDRILAGWREAQMRFELAVPGSAEAARAADEVSELRHEFQRSQNLKRAS
jgi:hypothetical protein